MKILQLAPVWETVPPPGYGGTETIISVLTEELVRRGHEVLLCASGDSVTSARLFCVVPESLRVAGLTANPVQYAAMHVAASLSFAGEFDVVHNHNGPPSDLGMAGSASIETPMLTTLHNMPAKDTRFIWDHYRGWYNTISDQQTNVIEPLPNARFAGRVHNGIDVDSFPFQAEKQDYAFFMARMSPEKAPHLAIEAALAAGSRIVLAGKISTEDEHEYFEAKVRPLLSLPGVDYVGEADGNHKRELYRNARVQLVPLLWEEPFGLVMVEAMACGTPVIAFKRGAAPELVIDGVTGALVDDVAGMARALDSISSIDPMRCRAHVEAHFSAQALADNYLAVYEKILGEEGVPLDHVA
jgi:glycosyltransferase involved in cell wall biosynthesis